MNVTHKLAKEFIAMLELMDRSPRVNRFIWFLTLSGLFIVILWKLPAILPTIADFWLKVRG